MSRVRLQRWCYNDSAFPPGRYRPTFREHVGAMLNRNWRKIVAYSCQNKRRCLQGEQKLLVLRRASDV